MRGFLERSGPQSYDGFEKETNAGSPRDVPEKPQFSVITVERVDRYSDIETKRDMCLVCEFCKRRDAKCGLGSGGKSRLIKLG